MFVSDLYMLTVLYQNSTIKISTKNNDCLTRLPNKAILHIQYLADVSLVWQYIRQHVKFRLANYKKIFLSVMFLLLEHVHAHGHGYGHEQGHGRKHRHIHILRMNIGIRISLSVLLDVHQKSSSLELKTYFESLTL
jgi:hypothetical protein